MASEERLKDYKFKGRTTEAARERRVEEKVQLRKAKREEQSMKKRNIDFDQPEQPAMTDEAQHSTLLELCQQLQVQDYGIISNAVVRLRELFSRPDDPPIEAACQLGCIPLIVQLLHYHDFPDVQFEAAWCLTNVTASTHDCVQTVLSAGAAEPLIALLSSKHLDTKDQACWALGNIAGDCETFRDLMLDAGALQPLIAIITKESRDDLIRNANWALSNLCRGKKPRVEFAKVEPALTVLHRLLYSEDEQLLIDACWALAFISQGPARQIERIIQAGVVGQLVRLAMHTKFAIVTPALRALGNISGGNDRQTQILLNNQLLVALRSLIGCHKEAIRKETCWVLSNILAGTEAQIKEVVRSGIIPDMVKRMEDGVYKTRREACWALCNMCVSGTGDQVEWLMGQSILPGMVCMLSVDDNTIIGVVLHAMFKILERGYQGKHQPNRFYDAFDEAGCIEKIENVLTHDDQKLYEAASQIIESFLRWEDAPDDQTTAPMQDPTGQMYTFGMPAAAPSAANVPGSPFGGYNL
eukprot:TRINITY_DN2774_c0_g1_i2.p1 TRINITY_DN2774_c0_g1~~TRINITY_DN2774_c0_g1_i2.p1  ORF type:complete len:527 (+),score=97.21 TRINITY_DN2774_c0_g1_i2:138-1718(+)